MSRRSDYDFTNGPGFGIYGVERGRVPEARPGSNVLEKKLNVGGPMPYPDGVITAGDVGWCSNPITKYNPMLLRMSDHSYGRG